MDGQKLTEVNPYFEKAVADAGLDTPGLMEEVKALLSSARQEKQAAPAEEDQP